MVQYSMRISDLNHRGKETPYKGNFVFGFIPRRRNDPSVLSSSEFGTAGTAETISGFCPFTALVAINTRIPGLC